MDSTVTAVPDMVLGHQILWIQIPFHAVGRGRFAETPQPLQGELGIRIDNRGNGVIQIFLGNVSLVDEGQLESVKKSGVKPPGLRL